MEQGLDALFGGVTEAVAAWKSADAQLRSCARAGGWRRRCP